MEIYRIEALAASVKVYSVQENAVQENSSPYDHLYHDEIPQIETSWAP
jgi:hypothetical protein